MRLLTSLVLAGAVLTLTAPRTAQGGSQAATPYEEPPSSCPITKPSDPPFIPPAPYPSVGNSWIGTAKLWTFVPSNGMWWSLPHYTPEDSRFRQELFWWHEGYDFRTENPPELTVTGKRLDGPAPPITMDEHANNGWTSDSNHPFMVVGIFIPTPGCWEITGRYKGEELSYVVWVAASLGQSSKCDANDLLAVLKPNDAAYADAMALAQTLQGHGFVVKCVLQSKMVGTFDGQMGAALFRSDHGDFEALFLPDTDTFDYVESISQRENGRFLYSFRGSPRPASPHPIDSAYPMFFAKHANQFFITSDSQLAASIVKAVR